MRPRMVLAPLLLACILLTPGCAKFNFWRKAESPTLACPCVGAPAPELGGVDFDGNPVKLSDYRGKVVVVAFWATWCPPCMQLIPHERALVERFKDKPFAMIGVNNDSEPEKAEKVIRTQRMSWRNCKTCGNGVLNRRWGVTGIPSIHVIDADGVLRHSDLRGEALDHAIETLVAEAEKKR